MQPVTISIESMPHSEDFSKVILNRPAPNGGAFLIHTRLEKVIWNQIKPFAHYYDADFLEDCDMFNADEGWRYTAAAIDKLINLGLSVQLHGEILGEVSDIFAIEERHQANTQAKAEREATEKAEREANEKAEREAKATAYKALVDKYTEGLVGSTSPKLNGTYPLSQAGYTQIETAENLEIQVWEKDNEKVVLVFGGNASTIYAKPQTMQKWLNESVDNSIENPSNYLINTILHFRGVEKMTDFSNCYMSQHYKIIAMDAAKSDKAIENFIKKVTDCNATADELKYPHFLRYLDANVNGIGVLYDFFGIQEQVKIAIVEKGKQVAKQYAFDNIERLDSHYQDYLVLGKPITDDIRAYDVYVNSLRYIRDNDFDTHKNRFIQLLKERALCQDLSSQELDHIQKYLTDKASSGGNCFVKFDDGNISLLEKSLRELGIYDLAVNAYHTRQLAAYRLAYGETSEKYLKAKANFAETESQKAGRLLREGKITKCNESITKPQKLSISEVLENKIVHNDQKRHHGRSVAELKVLLNTGETMQMFQVTTWWAGGDDADETIYLTTTLNSAKTIYNQYKD